jgi:hypothetical protein
MQEDEKKKSTNLFWIITSSLFVAAIIWFAILPIVFNSGSSLIKDLFSKKEEPKIETFSPEAFAYDIGDGWEVDATTRVKGFAQNENEGKYSATLAFDVDLVTAKGDTVKELISRVEDKTDKERMTDVPLEAQFDLDSTYTMGDYKVIFKIKDVISNQTAVSTASFKLSKD